MATPRAVRIPRASSPSGVASAEAARPSPVAALPTTGPDRRPNVGGSQRAIRLSTLFVVVLGLLYASFVLYARTASWGASSPEGNGLVSFTVIFLAVAVGGAVIALSPAPRAIEVAHDGVTVIGRWGRRRKLPPIDRLSVHVVRRYPAGWLSNCPVELIELWAEDTPRRSYLVDADLFEGAASADRPR